MIHSTVTVVANVDTGIILLRDVCGVMYTCVFIEICLTLHYIYGLLLLLEYSRLNDFSKLCTHFFL